MSRALTTKNIYDYKPLRFLFTGIWLAVLGAPEMRGVWLVWGKDKNGKTWGTLLLVNYLSTMARVDIPIKMTPEDLCKLTPQS